MNYFSTIALILCIKKILEQLLLHLYSLRSAMHLTHCTILIRKSWCGRPPALTDKQDSHLDKASDAGMIMFFDFFSSLNTIQPVLLRDKLIEMRVDSQLVST